MIMNALISIVIVCLTQQRAPTAAAAPLDYNFFNARATRFPGFFRNSICFGAF